MSELFVMPSRATPPFEAVVVERLECLFKRMFKSDTARLSSPLGGTVFLIVGNIRNTRDDEGMWVDQKGKRRDWDYVAEECIASGDTVMDLVRSARRYRRLCSMSMEEFLMEEAGHE